MFQAMPARVALTVSNRAGYLELTNNKGTFPKAIRNKNGLKVEETIKRSLIIEYLTDVESSTTYRSPQGGIVFKVEDTVDYFEKDKIDKKTLCLKTRVDTQFEYKITDLDLRKGSVLAAGDNFFDLYRIATSGTLSKGPLEEVSRLILYNFILKVPSNLKWFYKWFPDLAAELIHNHGVLKLPPAKESILKGIPEITIIPSRFLEEEPSVSESGLFSENEDW